jgi:hypothetical protein
VEEEQSAWMLEELRGAWLWGDGGGVTAVACLMFKLLWLGGAVAVNAAITQAQGG